MAIVTKKKAAIEGNGVSAWSFSRLNKYEDCPRKFKLTVLDKLPEPGSPAMDRGKLIHAEAEAYLKGNQDEVPTSCKLLEIELSEARALSAESELEVTFTKDWQLTGWFDSNAWCRIKIDVLMRKDGIVHIIDLKTGKNRGGYEDQLELYCLAALLMYPELDKISAELWFVDSGEILATSHGDYTQKHVAKLKKKWEKRVLPMFVDTLWSPRPNQYCRNCIFRKDAGGQCDY